MSARSSRIKPQRSLQGNRWVIVMSDHVDELAIVSVHRTKESTTQFDRMLRDRIKHGLQISWRATNNPKNVARGGLLLQRLAKFSRLRGDCSLLRGYRLLQLRKGLHARCGAWLLRAFF